MKLLNISTGLSRKTKTKWKVSQITWEELKNQLKQTTRTRETLEQYRRLSKDKQSDIKDIGGFVGGDLKDGRRGNEYVISRSMLTLDIDEAVPGFWDDFQVLNEFACCIYSTHKHTPDAPRLRLVAPFSRDVTPDEYVAISRRIAESIGIEMMDPASYRPAQLMYWPSTSKDGDFFYAAQEGDWIDPDEVLATYTDWTNIAEYPVSPREKDLRKNSGRKQGDPLEKKGIVGDFCRAYSIQDAIETFLPETYTSAGENRYTYTGGSSAAGAVVYNDKFLYSNHATDPTSDQLCNAFDLVRIHKFGSEDENVNLDGKSPSQYPSYKAMTEFALKDPRVLQIIAEQKTAELREAFSEDVEELEPINTDWLNQLTVNPKTKELEPTINNYRLILENDPHLQNVGGINMMGLNHCVFGDLPWRKAEYGEWWREDDNSGLYMYFERPPYNSLQRKNIDDALTAVVYQRAFSPVQDYLDTLEWDGEERLDTLLIRMLGADDNAYVRAVTRKTLTAAVARAYQPGIKFDTVLTLHGEQGIGKSMFWRILADPWFSDSLNTFETKVAAEQTQGAWIVEMGELNVLKKAELEQAKQYISKQEDQYRGAYKKETARVRRYFILVGTTNNDTPLRDVTGGRRWWMVHVNKVQSPAEMFAQLKSERDQIWAEAKYRWKHNEPLTLPEWLEDSAKAIQEEYTEADSRIGEIQAFLDRPITENWYTLPKKERYDIMNGLSFNELPKAGWRRDVVCAKEILRELYNDDRAGSETKALAQQINRILSQIPGWKRYSGNRLGQIKIDSVYGTQRAFVRIGGNRDGGESSYTMNDAHQTGGNQAAEDDDF